MDTWSKFMHFLSRQCIWKCRLEMATILYRHQYVKVLSVKINDSKWNAGNVFHATDFKGSDPGMHHVTCVTHVPWCMSGSLTSGVGENAPGIPVACTTRNFTYLVRGPCPHEWVLQYTWWHGNTCGIIGPWWWEFGHWWVPSQKGQFLGALMLRSC